MSLTSKLIAKILMLCGISLTCTACYGIPSTGYMTMIEGKVLDEATGEPIEGIKIRSNGYSSGQDMTDVEGRFHFWHGSQPPTTITLTVEDIDGPENGGEWASQSRQTEISKKNFAPGSNGHEWEGHWEVDFALKLKPQEDENE